jgi:hypothetical protein
LPASESREVTPAPELPDVVASAIEASPKRGRSTRSAAQKACKIGV